MVNIQHYPTYCTKIIWNMIESPVNMGWHKGLVLIKQMQWLCPIHHVSKLIDHTVVPTRESSLSALAGTPDSSTCAENMWITHWNHACSYSNSQTLFSVAPLGIQNTHCWMICCEENYETMHTFIKQTMVTDKTLWWCVWATYIQWVKQCSSGIRKIYASYDIRLIEGRLSLWH